MTSADWSGVASTYLDYFKSDEDRLRRELLDPIMLSSLNPPDKTILDLGCGEGYFTRVIKAADAKRVIGVDIAPGLIKSAREQDPAGEYEICDIVTAPVLWPRTFDAVVAHMVMMDVSDLDTTYLKIAKSLVCSGRLVLSIVNPYYAFPVGEWRAPPKPPRSWRHLGKRLPHKSKYDSELFITEYFGSRLVQKRLGDCSTSVPHFHRQLSDYLNLAAKHGLVLSAYLEPAMDRIPLFLVLQFDKAT